MASAAHIDPIEQAYQLLDTYGPATAYAYVQAAITDALIPASVIATIEQRLAVWQRTQCARYPLRRSLIDRAVVRQRQLRDHSNAPQNDS